MQTLSEMVLAPWIQKATALIGEPRRVGGNQFRHAMATFAILLDYKIIDPILLKASVIHDLIEDVPSTNIDELYKVDVDAGEVVKLALEVTRKRDESKREYLQRLRDHGSRRAKTLKVADRISNLTDLHTDIDNKERFQRSLEETAEFVLPIALELNVDMALELEDLMKQRREILP